MIALKPNEPVTQLNETNYFNGKEVIMRERLMEARMKYLRTALVQLRNLISTRELSRNYALVRQIDTVEQHLKRMEHLYVNLKAL